MVSILLCSGNGRLSRTIRVANYLTGVRGPACKISHVAMRFGQKGECVFESTTMNKWAIKDGQPKTGVQINHYDKWLENYNGKVWERATDVSYKLLEKPIMDILGTPYESGIPGLLELLGAILQLQVRDDLDEIHCSESVVKVLQDIGFVPRETQDHCKIIPANYPPHTFWDGGCFEWIFKGYLGKCNLIKE